MASTLRVVADCCDACVGSSTVAITGTVGWYQVADLGALRLVASSVANKFAVVGTLSGGFIGEFYWDAASVDADDGLTIIASSDGGVGRWKKLL